MQNNVRISFLIVHYSDQTALRKCVEELLTLTKKLSIAIEVLIANNSSSDIDNLPWDDVKVYNSKENIGFGSAHNKLATKASGRHLFFLNPDTYNFNIDFMSWLGKFSHNNSLGIIAPTIYTDQGDIELWSYGNEITLTQLICNHLFSKKYATPQNISSLSWVSGAAFMMPRNLFLELKGFDEGFFLYYEDADLCKRLRSAGYGIVRSQTDTLQHSSGTSMDSVTKQKEYYYTSQDRYFSKYHTPIACILVKLLRNIKLS